EESSRGPLPPKALEQNQEAYERGRRVAVKLRQCRGTIDDCVIVEMRQEAEYAAKLRKERFTRLWRCRIGVALPRGLKLLGYFDNHAPVATQERSQYFHIVFANERKDTGRFAVAES